MSIYVKTKSTFFLQIRFPYFYFVSTQSNVASRHQVGNDVVVVVVVDDDVEVVDFERRRFLSTFRIVD